LPERAPRLVFADELAADQLGVADDAVGAEVHKVVGLGPRGPAAGVCASTTLLRPCRVERSAK
jgi:hypothetical protein